MGRSTKEITRTVRNMGMEFSHGQMEISMKEITRTVRNMVKAYKHGQVGGSM